MIFSDEVEEKILSRFYRNSNIAFDSTIWAEDYSDIPSKREIPAMMFETLEGKEVLYTESGPTGDWSEGTPM